MWVTCFMNLKDNLFFPVFSVQFCSSYLQPEFPIVMLSFLLLHCDMIYLVLVSLLGGQQAHGQLIWAVGTWMVMPQDTPSWPVCAPSPSPSWWLPMKGSKDHLQIPRWNSALRALKAGVCTGGGVCYPPPVSGVLVNGRSCRALVITFGHLKRLSTQLVYQPDHWGPQRALDT